MDAGSQAPEPVTIRAVVAYDGTDFSGFQRQYEGLLTIGGLLEDAFARIFKRPTPVAAAGRTDSGVHASAQVISFPAPAHFPIERLPLAVKEHLPAAISIHEPCTVAAGWSARFAAVERRYVYLLHTARERHALRSRFYGIEYRGLDLERMRVAAGALVGRHDFRSFCGVPPNNGTERTLHELRIDRLDSQTVRFELRADGFLHRMVRITVGTLIETGCGRRRPEDMAQVLAARDRRRAGQTASAAGLYLAGVRYPDFEVFREPWL